MRNRLREALILAGAAALLSAPARAVTHYTVNLNSANVPASANGGKGSQSPGFGTASVTLSTDEKILTYNLSIENLLKPAGDPNAGQPDTAVAAHFHLGAPGVEGPVHKTIWAGTPYDITNPMVFTGSWGDTDATQPFTTADLDALKAGNLYINVHTRLFPGGAIRGQVVPAGAIPEPGTLSLLGSSLLPAALAMRRRRR